MQGDVKTRGEMMPKSNKPKTKLELTCYRCGNKSSKTLCGNTKELNEKIRVLRGRWKCKKCGSRSFRYKTVY